MATTLFVRKVGGKGVKLLTLGGDPSRWAVGNGDGDGELATASLRLSRYELDIDVRGRRLTAPHADGDGRHIQKSSRSSTTEPVRRVIDGQDHLWEDTPSTARTAEEWTVTLATGRTISWLYARSPDKLGFYDTNGAPVLRIGHDPSFDTAGQGRQRSASCCGSGPRRPRRPTGTSRTSRTAPSAGWCLRGLPCSRSSQCGSSGRQTVVTRTRSVRRPDVEQPSVTDGSAEPSVTGWDVEAFAVSR